MLLELEKNEKDDVSGGAPPCSVWAVAQNKCITFPAVSGSTYYVWINCCNTSAQASMQCGTAGAYGLPINELENCLLGENLTICSISGNPEGHYCCD
jgi:hypothetical protein